MYHDEYQACDADSSSTTDKLQARRKQLEDFDKKVHSHAKTIPEPPSVLKGRVARNKFVKRVSNKADGKSSSTVQPLGLDTHEVAGNEDTSGITYGAQMHIWLGEVAKRSALGHHVHRYGYHREQFGQRRKLKPETLQRLGRPPVPAVSQSTTAPTTDISKVDQDQEDPEQYFGRVLQNETDEDVVAATSISPGLPGATGGASDNTADAESSSKYAVGEEGMVDALTESTANSQKHGQHSGQHHHAGRHSGHKKNSKELSREVAELPPLVPPHHGSYGQHGSGNSNAKRANHGHHGHHEHHRHHEHQEHEKP
eukprot:COSAG02_NODE_3820_length_6190_cov_1.860121_9_plen_312_part_00